MLPFNGHINEKRTLVRTQVVLDDGKIVPVDYAFRKSSDGYWKAYDVIIEGISYMTNYRNQVAAEIPKSSLDALTTRLEKQGADALETMEKDGKERAVLRTRGRYARRPARDGFALVCERGPGAGAIAAAPAWR